MEMATTTEGIETLRSTAVVLGEQVDRFRLQSEGRQGNTSTKPVRSLTNYAQSRRHMPKAA